LFMRLYFFFFFKQKTAYEMRISDWSSDVCSSDLRFPQCRCRQANIRVPCEGAGDAFMVVGDHAACAARDAAEIVRQSTDHQVADQEEVGGARTDLGRAYEIGRASCRERVCQYV